MRKANAILKLILGLQDPKLKKALVNNLEQMLKEEMSNYMQEGRICKNYKKNN